MEYRLGKIEDLDDICELITSAVDTMEKQGIHQWDERYPIREDFEADIQSNTLYTVIRDGVLVGVYVISRECDGEYDSCKWESEDATACILHRLCVSPEIQNQGIGRQILNHLEEQTRNFGFGSVRLDVFSENPYAIRLYEKNGYIRRGYADWRKGRFWLMEKNLNNDFSREHVKIGAGISFS